MVQTFPHEVKVNIVGKSKEKKPKSVGMNIGYLQALPFHFIKLTHEHWTYICKKFGERKQNKNEFIFEDISYV